MTTVKNIFFYVIKKWKIILLVILAAGVIGTVYSAYSIKKSDAEAELATEEEVVEVEEVVEEEVEEVVDTYNNKLTIYLPVPETLEENMYYGNTIRPIATSICRQYVTLYEDKLVYVDSGSMLSVEMKSEADPESKAEAEAILSQIASDIINNTKHSDELYGLSLGKVNIVITSTFISKEELLELQEDIPEEIEEITEEEQQEETEEEPEPFAVTVIKGAAKYAVVGFLLIIVLLIFIYLISDTIKSFEDLEINFPKIPVCGVLRKSKYYNKDLNDAFLNLKYQLKDKLRNEWIFTGIPDSGRLKDVYSNILGALTSYASEENVDNVTMVLSSPENLSEDFYEECRAAGGLIIIAATNTTKAQSLNRFIHNLNMQDIRPQAFILIEN